MTQKNSTYLLLGEKKVELKKIVTCIGNMIVDSFYLFIFFLVLGIFQSLYKP